LVEEVLPNGGRANEGFRATLHRAKKKAPEKGKIQENGFLPPKGQQRGE